MLVWSPRSHRLAILQAEKHQNLSQWDGSRCWRWMCGNTPIIWPTGMNGRAISKPGGTW